jgi:hypothetical protein
MEKVCGLHRRQIQPENSLKPRKPNPEQDLTVLHSLEAERGKKAVEENFESRKGGELG